MENFLMPSNLNDLLQRANPASQNVARPPFTVCASLAIIFLMLAGAIYAFAFYLFP
jgi:hypothetical protein